MALHGVTSPPDDSQAQSSLEVAIESDEFVPVSEAEMETMESIAAIDQLMSEEQDRIRALIVDPLTSTETDDAGNAIPPPLLADILTLLNFEGEIGEDEIGAAAEFYGDWVNRNITPQVNAQERFYVGGAVVQRTTEAL